MNNLRMVEEENDEAAEVTWEDQQHISTFSKLNTRLRWIEDKREALKEEKDALDDIATELELTDEDQIVPCKIGESLLHLSQPRALKRLEKEQAEIAIWFAGLAAIADECEKGMKELKIMLYVKFGSAINLDE